MPQPDGPQQHGEAAWPDIDRDAIQSCCRAPTPADLDQPHRGAGRWRSLRGLGWFVAGHQRDLVRGTDSQSAQRIVDTASRSGATSHGVWMKPALIFGARRGMLPPCPFCLVTPESPALPVGRSRIPARPACTGFGCNATGSMARIFPCESDPASLRPPCAVCLRPGLPEPTSPFPTNSPPSTSAIPWMAQRGAPGRSIHWCFMRGESRAATRTATASLPTCVRTAFSPPAVRYSCWAPEVPRVPLPRHCRTQVLPSRWPTEHAHGPRNWRVTFPGSA